MFTLYRVDFVPATKPYRIGPLPLTHKNGNLGGISATERSRPVPISKVENHISDRCPYYNGYLFVFARKVIP